MKKSVERKKHFYNKHESLLISLLLIFILLLIGSFILTGKFIFIKTTKADHLDENKNVISNIHDKISHLDDIWSETINDGEYVRVTFEQELSNTNDITVYVRGNGNIEVYEVDGTEIIATFDNIIENEYNKVYLTNLNGTQDVFDLKIVGGNLEFDHIIDPGNTYYIDYSAGDDSNSGTSTASAWKHSPGDYRASGNANIVLSPGDTVVFKGGVVYSFDNDLTDYLAATSSGNSANWITYQSGHLHSTPWPNSATRAIIDGTDSSYASGRRGILALKSYDYLKVEGLKIQDTMDAALYTGCISSNIPDYGNIIINDNILFGCDNGIYIRGDWNSDGNPPSNYTITNNEIYGNCEHGMLIRADVEGITIENNIIHDNGFQGAPCVGDGLFTADGASAVRPHNIIIRNNSFYDGIVKGHIVFQGAHNVLIEKNHFWEDDDYVMFGVSISEGDNYTIRNNLFEDNNEVFEYEGMIRIITNNGIPTPNDITNVKIYSNTLYGESCRYPIWVTWGDGYNVINLTIKNNIIDMGTPISDNCGGSANYLHFKDGTIESLDSDYNIFYNGDSAPFYWGGASKTFAQWKTDTGNDLNSQETNPLLDANYKPDDASDPSVDAGVDLSSTGFSEDKDSISRPQGSEWDIGAYEYFNQSPSNDPVVTLDSPLDDASTSTTVTFNCSAIDNLMLSNQGDGMQMKQPQSQELLIQLVLQKHCQMEIIFGIVWLMIMILILIGGIVIIH
jgi:hypothetical protein